MRISFHTAILHELDVVEAVDAIVAAGYDAVELNAESFPWGRPHVGPETSAAVREALSDRGVVSSIAAHRPGLASGDEQERRDAIEWTIGCGQLAVDVGADIIHVIPGDQPDTAISLGVASERGDLSSFVESLQEVVRRVGDLGITVSLEPIVNQLVSTTDEALDVLRRVPGLKISFDASHLQVTTHDVLDAARRLGPYVVIVAIKDAVGDPDDFKFLAQGEGVIDFPAMLDELRNHGFDGDLVVEHEGHLFGDARSPEIVLHESLTSARQLLEQYR